MRERRGFGCGGLWLGLGEGGDCRECRYWHMARGCLQAT
jgi:hypothetical protein